MECKYILYDVLESLKNMVVNYAIALNEASSESIYKEYKKQFDKLSMMSKELFNYAYEKSWYKLEEVQATKITKEINKMQKEMNP